jgi:hypothetical protein
MAEWYEQLLEHQLERNREVWTELRDNGVEDGSELRLGFLYVAPGVAEADQLVAFLHEETDYEVRSCERPGDVDVDAEPDWVVIGTTQPTPVSLELLDDWCEWMIAAGAAEGPCAFDGWAAQLVGDDEA